MFTKLCIALLLMSSLASTQGDVQCPKECTCGRELLTNIMECVALPAAPINLSISHFSIKHARHPLLLTSAIFAKLGLKHVNSISISNSTIASIDKSAFHNLTDLTYVTLAHVNLVELHPDTFKQNLNLNRLNLSGNPLDINRLISSNTVAQLDLSNCGIKALKSDAFQNLIQLEFIDLSNNHIESVSVDAFTTLEELNEINLSNNKIKQLQPNTFTKNINLQILDLSYNPLVSFTSGECESLQTLNLGSCLLQKLDARMFANLKDLSELNLANNRINSVELSTFAQTTELTVINLSGNKLTALHEKLFINNKKLQKIILDNLNLDTLPVYGFQLAHGKFDTYYFSCNNCNLRVLPKNAFMNMPDIVSLYLSNNKINDVSTGVFQGLSSVNEIDLSHNEISTLDDSVFKNNLNLNNLHLSHNSLKALHANTFAKNKNLQHLDLSSCGLFTLWSKSTGTLVLPALLSLNISHNNINIITKHDIEVSSGLKNLDLSENPLECSEHLRELIEYLEENGIKDGKYITHEEMGDGYIGDDEDTLEWKELGESRCPIIKGDDDYNESDLDELYYKTGEFGDDYVTETAIRSRVYVVDELKKDADKVVLRLRHGNYSHWWPILVFIGTAMIVLGTVANIILCVIRRRQSFTIPNIIQVRNVPKIKNNSGLVYHKLSEEHVPNIVVK